MTFPIKNDDLTSLALQLARKSAGFSAAALAAAHFGWPMSRYRAHEAGTRNILAADLRKYAEGFNVSLDRLVRPQRHELERVRRELGADTRQAAIEIAQRIRCARILRGHASGRRAAVAIGVKPPTFLKHENGENGLSPEMAGFYASIFGISRSWLIAGTPPSGFGPEIDRIIERVVRSPRSYVSLAQVSPNSSPLVPNPLELKPGRRPRPIQKISEYLWSELEGARGDVDRTIPHGVLQIPALPGEMYDAERVFVVVDVSHRRPVKFSRLLVSKAARPSEGEFLVFEHGRLDVRAIVSDLQAASLIVGEIVGRINPPRSDTD